MLEEKFRIFRFFWLYVMTLEWNFLRGSNRKKMVFHFYHHKNHFWWIWFHTETKYFKCNIFCIRLIFSIGKIFQCIIKRNIKIIILFNLWIELSTKWTIDDHKKYIFLWLLRFTEFIIRNSKWPVEKNR